MISSVQSLGMVLLGAAGGLAGALALFRVLGTKWLEASFAKRLQELKHQHGREIERLRFKINDLLDRSSKLNQREFDVLPQAWSLVFDAFVAAERLVTRLRRIHDFSSMPAAHMEDVLSSSRLAEWQREELRALKPFDRTLYFTKAMYWYELHDAKVAAQEADFYLMKYGIFLSDTLHEKLNGFVQFVWNAISDHELRREMREDGAPLRGEPSPAEDFRENADRMVKELSAQLRSCFRPAQHLID